MAAPQGGMLWAVPALYLTATLAATAMMSPVAAFVAGPPGSARSSPPVAELRMQRLGSRGGAQAGFRQGSVTGSRTLSRGAPLLESDASRFWVNPFPLKPYTVERETVARQVDKDIFVFEQEHGFANVSVNIRMTVVRLSDGGLWVHAPVAPTAQCVEMVKTLGEVKHIVLPTTGLEHKTFMGPFVKAFPQAKAYVAPGQWSWPIDVPLGFEAEVLRDMDPAVPWAKEIEQKIVYAEVGIGKCSEVAFFHKKSSTLLVTDAVIYIPPGAPDILRSYREESAMEFEKWKKSALMACFLGAPYTPSFDAIAGKVFVSPVVRTFIYERTVDETSEWVKRIAQWRFNKIIPAHLDAPIAAGPAEFLAAFEFLERPTANPLPSGDMRPLNAISKLLTLTGLVPPRAADMV